MTKEENIWARVEEPTVTKEGLVHCNERIKHPAFGQISASRVSGKASLYGSDFEHQHYISITIGESELSRNLSRDWPFRKNELIEVSLSEAQWATFVSSLNCGQGTQCTIRHANREPRPLLPKPKKRSDQFAKEAEKSTEIASEKLSELADMIKDSKLSAKLKDEFLKKINSANMAIGSNVKFVLDQFGEHMEATTEKAKIEVEAYINNRVMRAGLEALSADERPIKLIERD